MAHLIKGVTSDSDLTELANILDIDINGIYELSEILNPLPKKGLYLILLRKDSDVGHWVCVNDNAYFDSAGSLPPTIFGNLDYSTFQYQGSSDQFCGIWCLL